MDPLSLTASLIAVIETSGQLISYCYKYQSAVRHAAQDAKKIGTEVTGLLGTLQRLLSIAQDEEERQTARLPTLQALAQPDGLLTGCQTELTSLMAKMKPKTGWDKIQSSLVWPLQKGEVKEALDRIHRITNGLNLALTTENTMSTLALREDFASFSIDSHRKEIYDWLKAPDPSIEFNAGLSQREPGTGGWLLDGTQMRNWQKNPKSFLWLNGIPGCGKTVLCSSIIQHWREYCKSRPGHGCAYFYFTFRDQSKQTCESLIKSLVIQLASQTTQLDVELEELYSQYHPSKPQLESLVSTLRHLISGFTEVYVIIDALDECTEVEKLLRTVQTFSDWDISSLHLLATSRPEKVIKDVLDRPQIVNIPVDKTFKNEDILVHVRAQLQVDPYLKRWSSKPEIQAEIETCLVDKAHGMFRWVECQLASIRKCIRVSQLRRALADLPKDLDETYARIIVGISEENKADAIKLLQWLCYSLKPISLEMAADILATGYSNRLGRYHFDPDERPPEIDDVLLICSSLVSLGEKGELQLAHFSVKEYLTSERVPHLLASSDYNISSTISNLNIAEVCLAYVMDSSPSITTEDSIKLFPLFNYAENKWFHHYLTASDAAIDSKAEALLMCFLNEDAYLKNFLSVHPDQIENGTLQPFGDPVYYASWCGLTRILKKLVKMESKGNCIGGPSGIALEAAAQEVGTQKPHLEILKILLEAGLDVNAVGGYHGSAIQGAAYFGNVEMVEYLLSNGADVNLAGGEYGCALQAAAIQDYDRVVEVLLEHGANVNAEGGEYGAAIIAAAGNARWTSLKLLVEKGADVNRTSKEFGTAMHQCLIRLRDQINATGKHWVSTVEIRAEKFHPVDEHSMEQMESAATGIRRLVHGGVDLNILVEKFETPLQMACCIHPEWVKLFLDHGADPNLRANRGSPLQLARSVRTRYLKEEHMKAEIVNLLLKYGANDDEPGEMQISDGMDPRSRTPWRFFPPGIPTRASIEAPDL